jgi:nucleotide-binding universal stress UspA family protein
MNQAAGLHAVHQLQRAELRRLEHAGEEQSMITAKNILVATDFSELGRTAVEQALSLAETLDAQLNVVSVFTQLSAPESASRAGTAEDQAVRALRAAVCELETKLRPSGRLARAVVQFGDPAPTILVAAQELNADLIVLGTHGRRGLSRLVMGSTAEQVLRQASVPVLIVKGAPAARATTGAAQS